uniref:Nucleoprotein n=1 Tax=Shelduck rhabdovirus TaxID=2212784 RepID=A0A3G1RPH8_9RHAB|nr:MAG: nucleocapsid protein [Shelduck rhabdovirus]
MEPAQEQQTEQNATRVDLAQGQRPRLGVIGVDPGPERPPSPRAEGPVTHGVLDLQSRERRELDWSLAVVESPDEYPSTFFEAQRKPTITLHDANIETMRKIFYSALKDGKLDVEIGKHFLLAFSERYLKTTLTNTWTSYGITIKEAGQPVAPIDLLEVDTRGPFPAVETSGSYPMPEYSDEDKAAFDKAAALHCTGKYRLGRAGRPDYATILQNNCNNLINQIFRKENLTYAEPEATSWTADSDYCKLIAAIDMFLNKFPNHPCAEIRWGTLPSRHRDSAALTGCAHLCRVLGQDLHVAVQWAWVKSVANDLRRIFKAGEELAIEESYLPYMTDFKLVKLNPYSARKNPNIHNFVHIIGTLSGYTRSENSIKLDSIGFKDIMNNAVIVAYAVNKGTDIAPHFGTAAAKARLDSIPQTVPGVRDEPADADPMNWLAYLKRTGQKQLPKALELAAQQAATLSSRCRERSIGQAVAEFPFSR